ncbi:cyclic nucleotide-binding protein [Gloeothece citriformis PCC 7424]|uniref:Cyclic nucleotide-binding protein n=1 Tax=Gloeothece citriformis (strain PCC 7424) TaxID=65393 RepID=B7KKU0_GLOC7|nr:cyclic nucleotide-binding domain-containing protein [Gloeothece citriformis]ACK71059.1 cyclic nucleotide-binding protein [Gloeothece citriformis PCC 7424]
MLLQPTDTINIFKKQPDQIFAPGEIIFEQGQEGHTMFGVIEGEVEMSIEGKVIETIQAGDVFGQGAIIQEDHLRASTAKAKTQCKLAVLDREHFLFAVQQTPLFALQVMKSYSDRFRQLKETI